MLDILTQNLLKPLLSRIGTTAATLLVSYGVQQELATQVATGVTALGLILADLTIDWHNRQRARR